MNIVAHTDPKSKAVKGIKSDPFNPHIFATFSDVANEPIKVYILYLSIKNGIDNGRNLTYVNMQPDRFGT